MSTFGSESFDPLARDLPRLGLLGAARIAPQAVIEPSKGLVELGAVAARDPGRAQSFAEQYGIARSLDDYRELVEHPEIDAVYVGLPAALHAEWSIRALEAGKHVLCEKPFASNAREARSMVDAARRSGRLLMEAYHWRYHPMVDRLSAILRSGVLGRLRRVSAVFDAPIRNPGDIRYVYELGGGALMDLGCYAVQWLRFVTGSEPRVVEARAVERPARVDLSMRATLEFPDDVAGEISCSMAPEGSFVARLRVEGEEGKLTVENPLVPQRGHELVLVTQAGERREQVPGQSTYRHQLEAFTQALRTGREPPTGGVDAISTMDLIDAIYTACGLGPRGT